MVYLIGIDTVYIDKLKQAWWVFKAEANLQHSFQEGLLRE